MFYDSYFIVTYNRSLFFFPLFFWSLCLCLFFDTCFFHRSFAGGLGASIAVGDWGLGFSLTLPKVHIGTDNYFGIDFPTSAEHDRPRLAGIGISGPAKSVFALVKGLTAKQCKIKMLDALNDIAEPASRKQISISLGIGYVGILGDKRTNWFKNWAESTCRKNCAPAKGAGCNNLLTDVKPKKLMDCGDDVFEALPKSILTGWPYKN